MSSFPLLEQLITVSEGGSVSAAAAVYHRDYLSTRDKPYRKYKRKKKKKSSKAK